MLNCGIVGLGWWGQVLARSITGSSKIKVVKGFTRTPSNAAEFIDCLLYTSPSPRDRTRSRMPSSA